uniref:Uncharacterized protein n=1 Tax=Panagrellus redivivus TaxID=6233 RepID=A0A7E4UTM8_PANRE
MFVDVSLLMGPSNGIYVRPPCVRGFLKSYRIGLCFVNIAVALPHGSLFQSPPFESFLLIACVRTRAPGRSHGGAACLGASCHVMGHLRRPQTLHGVSHQDALTWTALII